MYREGADPNDMSMQDVLCDFCGSAWTEQTPMVEGHRGSCICGGCLSVAFAELVRLKQGVPLPDGEVCALCLSADKERPHWNSPVRDGAVVCSRCVKQAAGVLHKDDAWDWSKPT